MHHSVYTYFEKFIVSSCLSYMGNLLIEGSLIGPVYGNIFGILRDTKKDSEQFYFIIDIQRVMGRP